MENNILAAPTAWQTVAGEKHMAALFKATVDRKERIIKLFGIWNTGIVPGYRVTGQWQRYDGGFPVCHSNTPRPEVRDQLRKCSTNAFTFGAAPLRLGYTALIS